MAKQVKVLGTTDETSTCECCGKRNLKKVVVLDVEGEVVRYGCDCAARELRQSYCGRQVKVQPATIWETARWAMAPKERREMAGRYEESFRFQTRAA
jgi:hypothetical protein